MWQEKRLEVDVASLCETKMYGKQGEEKILIIFSRLDSLSLGCFFFSMEGISNTKYASHTSNPCFSAQTVVYNIRKTNHPH